MNLEEHENYDCHETVDVDDRADANLHIARFYCIMPGTCTVAHPCAVVASHLKSIKHSQSCRLLLIPVVLCARTGCLPVRHCRNSSDSGAPGCTRRCQTWCKRRGRSRKSPPAHGPRPVKKNKPMEAQHNDSEL